MKRSISNLNRATKLIAFTALRNPLSFNSKLSVINKQNFHSNIQLFNENQKYEISELEPSQYYNLSEKTMVKLLDQLEDLVQSFDDSQYDVEYSSGVLNLKLSLNGTYVINKQPPNKQIWLSSPLSGPKRYDYCSKGAVWFYSRDQSTLHELLSTELSKLLNKDIVLEL